MIITSSGSPESLLLGLVCSQKSTSDILLKVKSTPTFFAYLKEEQNSKTSLMLVVANHAKFHLKLELATTNL